MWGWWSLGATSSSFAEHEMPGLMTCHEESGPAQSLRGLNTHVFLHMTIQTDVTLQGLGATGWWTSFYIFSTQYHAVAGIARACIFHGFQLERRDVPGVLVVHHTVPGAVGCRVIKGFEHQWTCAHDTPIWRCQGFRFQSAAEGYLNGFTRSSKKTLSCVFSALYTYLCNAWQANTFRVSFWCRTAGVAYPAATWQCKQNSKCDGTQTDSPAQHTRCTICRQRKVCFTEECSFV